MSTAQDTGQAPALTRRGQGPPLLLLAGLGTHSAHWGEPLLTEIEGTSELLLLDHRGTGVAPRDRAAFTVTDLAADALAALDALAVRRVDVLGFSLGGMVAQELALLAPGRVRRLVLLATTPGLTAASGVDIGALAPFVEAMREHDGERALHESWRVNASAALQDDPTAFARWAAVNAARPFRVKTLERQVAAVASYRAAAGLEAIAQPALVVHGTLDRIVPFTDAERLVSLLPHARLERVEGAGHLVHWDGPQAVAAAVREHLG